METIEQNTEGASAGDMYQPHKERFYKGIKSYETGASKLTVWTLSIIAGSILIIVDNKYSRPQSICYRYFYFLFLAGWILLGISMAYGFSITRRAIAADLHFEKPKLLYEILEKCNSLFKDQFRFFIFGLLIFGGWLILFLTWWVFTVIPNIP